MSQPDPKPTAKASLEAVQTILTTLKTTGEAAPLWLRALLSTLLVVIAPTVMVNGYLRTYGQPALGTFGDNLIVGLLQSAGLFLVLLTALVGLILVMPLLTRHFFAHAQTGLGFADHVNTPILGAAKEPWRGTGKAHPGWAYVAANLSLFGLAIIEVCQHANPAFRQDWVAWPLLALSPVACVVLVQVTLKPQERAVGARTMAALLGVAFALSAWTWVSSVTTLLEPSFPPPTTSAWTYWAAVMACACAVHFVLSVASHDRGAAILMSALAIVATLSVAPGYRMLVFNALRAGNAGGGVTTVYPDPARKTLGGPMKTACLILNAGEYRIVRLTDDPEACSNDRARRFFGELLRATSETERRAKLCGVMPIRRDAFAGALTLPPQSRKDDDKTPPVALGCPPDAAKAP